MTLPYQVSPNSSNSSSLRAQEMQIGADRLVPKRADDRLLSPPDYAPSLSSTEPFAPLVTRLQSRKYRITFSIAAEMVS